MTSNLKSKIASLLDGSAAQAGLVLASATEGADFHGQPTAVFLLGLRGSEVPGRTLRLEPVSYTHLDVYKRQRLPAPRRVPFLKDPHPSIP